MDKNKNNPASGSDESSKEVYERTGSNDHNDYRIKGDEHKRDEKESYTDYNGNSEANNPARAEGMTEGE
jgi:hypothetical protein